MKEARRSSHVGMSKVKARIVRTYIRGGRGVDPDVRRDVGAFVCIRFVCSCAPDGSGGQQDGAASLN